MGSHRAFGRSPWSCVPLRDALARKAFLCHFSKILQHPRIHLKSDDCEGEMPAVGRGNGIVERVPWTCSPLPEYLDVAIQARIESCEVYSKLRPAVNEDCFSIERPALELVF